MRLLGWREGMYGIRLMMKLLYCLGIDDGRVDLDGRIEDGENCVY